MGEQPSISLPLEPDEQEMVRFLREELGLPDDVAVLRVLVQQAVQRLAITCPTCGHFAKLTAEDEANCHSCLSVIKLSEGLLQVEH